MIDKYVHSVVIILIVMMAILGLCTIWLFCIDKKVQKEQACEQTSIDMDETKELIGEIQSY